MYYLTSIHTCYVNYELIDVIIKKNVDIKVSPYADFYWYYLRINVT